MALPPSPTPPAVDINAFLDYFTTSTYSRLNKNTVDGLAYWNFNRTTYQRLKDITETYYNTIKSIPNDLNARLPPSLGISWPNVKGLSDNFLNLSKLSAKANDLLTLPFANLRGLDFTGISDLLDNKLYLNQLIAQIPALSTLSSGFGVGFSAFWSKIQSLYAQATTLIDLVVSEAEALPAALVKKITALVNSIVATITNIINTIKAKLGALKTALGKIAAPLTSTPLEIGWKESEYKIGPFSYAASNSYKVKGNGLFGLTTNAFNPNVKNSIAELYLVPPFYPADPANAVVAIGAYLFQGVAGAFKIMADNITGAASSLAGFP